VGGLNMARKVAACCEFFNVRSAWHGPGNVSPVGHAVNMHLDLSITNFGIQEQNVFSPQVREVFPGAPEIKGGYMYANDRPGRGWASTSTKSLRPSSRTRPREEAAATIDGWMAASSGLEDTARLSRTLERRSPGRRSRGRFGRRPPMRPFWRADSKPAFVPF